MITNVEILKMKVVILAGGFGTRISNIQNQYQNQ